MTLLKVIGWCLFIAIVLMIGPWLLIWSVNTLAAAGGATTFVIPFTFWTWLAALVFGGVLRGNSK